MLVCRILSTCINSPYRCPDISGSTRENVMIYIQILFNFPMHFLKYYLGEFKFDLQGPNANMQVVQVAWIFCCASLKKLILHEDSFSVVYCVRETRKKDEACYFKGNTCFYCIALVPLLVICSSRVSPYFISSCPKVIKSLALQVHICQSQVFIVETLLYCLNTKVPVRCKIVFYK